MRISLDCITVGSEDWMRQYKGKCFVNCKLLCGQYAISVADCFLFSLILWISSACYVSDAKPGSGNIMGWKQWSLPFHVLVLQCWRSHIQTGWPGTFACAAAHSWACILLDLWMGGPSGKTFREKLFKLWEVLIGQYGKWYISLHLCFHG